MSDKIAIIGAGAAGCFAAANIPYQEGREVRIYEKTGKSLQKVKVSGGGRCNVTHACFEVPELVNRYPRGKQLLKKSLYKFSPTETIEWFELRGVTLKTEADGRMFPVTDSSQTIIDCLWQEMKRNRTEIHYHKSIEKIKPSANGFELHFADGSIEPADSVLIACGAFPKPDHYKWITDLGHAVELPVPSLFTFNVPSHPIKELMGVSVPNATVKVAGTKFSESGPLLITHWGFSGPAVLRTSAWAARALHELQYHFRILINWLGDTDEADVKEAFREKRINGGKQIVNIKNPFDLPRRLWEFFCLQSGVTENTRWGELSAAAQNKLIERLIRDPYDVKGKTTFKEEFVTCGGVQLSEIDPQTMQSRVVPGLYFAGEILNVDGITGGFNFQHAWLSGMIAAANMIATKL